MHWNSEIFMCLLGWRKELSERSSSVLILHKMQHFSYTMSCNNCGDSKSTD